MTALVGPERATALGRAFAALEPRFDRIWRRDLPRLRDLSRRLETALAAPGVSRAARALETFFGCPFPAALTVHLLISRGENWSAGGANEGPGHVTLEALETRNLYAGLETILHEAAHLMAEQTLRPLLRSLAEQPADDQGWGFEYAGEEAVVESLLPDGCLSPLVGGKRGDYRETAAASRAAGRDREAALFELTAKLGPLTETYVGKGKPVDEAFAGEVARLYGEVCRPDTLARRLGTEARELGR